MSRKSKTWEPKELEKQVGCNVINIYENDKSNASLLMLGLMKDKEIKHSYYELVDKDGWIRYIIEDRITALSVAGRLGLDYREVEFKEVWQERK